MKQYSKIIYINFSARKKKVVGRWGKLHKFYTLTNIRVAKSGRMGWVGHIELHRDNGKLKMLLRKPEGKMYVYRRV
jgi:hypothetical protein